MFTGIIETTGKVISLRKEKSNLIIGIESSFAKELKIGQSVAHNGVCLTVESKGQGTKDKGQYFVTAVKETLHKSNLGLLKKGSIVNLERSLEIGDRLDGHFVQGHVDTTATCKEVKKQNGSFLFEFRIQNSEFRIKNLIINKGSICINGVSLTVVDVMKNIFSVAIIPHTFKHTNFRTMKKGSGANIEFDVLGKYIQKIISK
jgi:riboflavin synthase